MNSPTASKRTGRPVLVTTEYRGVFFGYAADTSGDTIHLKSARRRKLDWLLAAVDDATQKEIACGASGSDAHERMWRNIAAQYKDEITRRMGKP